MQHFSNTPHAASSANIENARKGPKIHNHVNLQGKEFAGVEFARNGLCKECVSYSLLMDYFVSISSVGGSIWSTIPIYMYRVGQKYLTV